MRWLASPNGGLITYSLILHMQIKAMSRKNDRYSGKAETRLTFSNWAGLVMLIGLFGWGVKTCVHNTTRNNALEGKTAQIRAIVIDEKNFYGNSPVSQTFSYSYRFSLNGKEYRGNTRDTDLRVGDSLTIKYVPENPEYNEPIVSY